MKQKMLNSTEVNQLVKSLNLIKKKVTVYIFEN